jgi:hypothetical protein
LFSSLSSLHFLFISPILFNLSSTFFLSVSLILLSLIFLLIPLHSFPSFLSSLFFLLYSCHPGRAIGARVLLGDRDVDITLSRLATAVSDSSSKRFENTSIPHMYCNLSQHTLITFFLSNSRTKRHFYHTHLQQCNLLSTYPNTPYSLLLLFSLMAELCANCV